MMKINIILFMLKIELEGHLELCFVPCSNI